MTSNGEGREWLAKLCTRLEKSGAGLVKAGAGLDWVYVQLERSKPPVQYQKVLYRQLGKAYARLVNGYAELEKTYVMLQNAYSAMEGSPYAAKLQELHEPPAWLKEWYGREQEAPVWLHDVYTRQQQVHAWLDRASARQHDTYARLETAYARRHDVQARFEPARSADLLLVIAVRLLPSWQRARYLEEFRAELLDISRSTQLRHALSLLRGVFVLRRGGVKNKGAGPAAKRGND